MTNAITVDSIDALYELYLNIESDIKSHLPRLKALASECDTVVEFGCRQGLSTAALLAGRPKRLITYDFCAQTLEQTAALLGSLCPPEIELEFYCGDTRFVEPIPECDLLWVDSYHSYAQVKMELRKHGHKATKFLAFHDTDHFGTTGEDGLRPSIRQAIYEFVEDSKDEWFILREYHDSNGMIVLKKRDIVI